MTTTEALLPLRFDDRLGPGSARCALATVERLRRRVDALVVTEALTRRELRAAQNHIRRLQRAGTAPTANDFWQAAAVPRARRLVTRIDEILADELWLMVEAIATLGPPPSPAVGAGPNVVTLATGGRTAPSADVTYRDVHGWLMASLPERADLDHLGRWWQRRLRFAATVAALPAVLAAPAAETELLVSHQEMTLLDRAPWSHGDRLLSAFELAYSELQAMANARIVTALRRLTAARPALVA